VKSFGKKRGAVIIKSSAKLSGQVLRIGCTASIAAPEHFPAIPVAAHNIIHEAFHLTQKSRVIHESSLELY
jgi:hypothetical protein